MQVLEVLWDKRYLGGIGMEQKGRTRQARLQRHVQAKGAREVKERTGRSIKTPSPSTSLPLSTHTLPFSHP